MDIYKPVYPGLYYFDTFTFTTLGTSGHRGPESTKTYANAPWREGDFSIVDGQQQWTVPVTGTYRIEAAGAYGATPGRVVSGDVILNEGQVVSLLVGQQPTPLTANVVDNVTVGGGGGTFVVSDGKPLIVASGGDGTGGSTAAFSPYGNGNGINGAGYLSNGSITNSTFQFLKPVAYVDGGYGNMYWYGSKGDGGFGGGQSPVATSNVSGGGGYTGSAGDGVSGATCYADPAVANFTDRGASGNTAGTVTISLIDPVPLKQTWSWGQTFTNTAPKTAIEVVNWSDKLGKFQSLTGSSTDGIHWDGYTIFEVVANAGSSEFPFYTAYSDTLNLYIGYRFVGFTFIYITSNDGIVWTEPVTEGLNGNEPDVMYNSSPFVWSPELGLFVFVSDTNILTSYDGIIWTERYYDPAFHGGRSIAYAPSIHTFVITATWYSSGYLEGLTPNTGVYSTDGLTWNTWTGVTNPVIEGQIVSGNGGSVTWSPKLNIFVASVTYHFIPYGEATYSNAYIARSTDGQTWTTDGFNIPNDPLEYGWNILWSEELSIFSAISIAGLNTTIHSYDGINWSSITASGVFGQLAYSPSLKLFVVSNDSGSRQFISIEGIYYVDIAGYYPLLEELYFTWAPQIGTFTGPGYGSITSDGVKWEKTTNIGQYGEVVCEWSPELGLYISLAFFANFDLNQSLYLYSYYSYDGKTWIYPGFEIAQPVGGVAGYIELPYVAWSPTLGVFSGAYYSRDGINWAPSLPDSRSTAVGWSSFHGMFVAFHYTDVYYSYDGTTWNTGINITGIISGFGKIACSSSGRFVCKAGISTEMPGESPQAIVPKGVLYSDDGINWISPGVDFSLRDPIWVEELSIFVASNNSEDNLTTGWISSDGITWSAINIQPGAWSPELGLFLCPGGYSPVTKTF